ncbi:uncharacterized protein V6R79_018303 [Siganus canaliculatus]
MDQWNLGPRLLLLLLLQPLHLCIDYEVTFEKTVGEKPDFTPVCFNDRLPVVAVTCRVSTKSMKGKECRLMYKNEWGTLSNCGTSLTLQVVNDTIVLNLSSLTPEHSGSYICECLNGARRYSLHHNITIKAKSGSSSTQTTFVVGVAVGGVGGGVAAVAIAAAVIGFILRAKRNRKRAGKDASPLSVVENNYAAENPDDVYDDLQQSTSDLYQNFSKEEHPDHDGAGDFEMDHDAVRSCSAENGAAAAGFEQEVDENTEDVYENI